MSSDSRPDEERAQSVEPSPQVERPTPAAKTEGSARVPSALAGRPRGGVFAAGVGAVVAIAALLTPHKPDYINGGAYVDNGFWTFVLIAAVATFGAAIFYLYQSSNSASSVAPNLPRAVLVAGVVTLLLGAWMLAAYGNADDLAGQRSDNLQETIDRAVDNAPIGDPCDNPANSYLPDC